MTQSQWIDLVVAVVCALVASLLAASEAALQSMTPARAERLAEGRGRRGKRLVELAEDPAPGLNTATFLRTTAEIVCTVLVSWLIFVRLQNHGTRLLLAIVVMVLISYIFWGVAPRTIGRQQAGAVALAAAGPVSLLTTIVGPVPQLMILIGNAVTPGKGVADGPFASEAELRAWVDLAEKSEVIEHGERQMIHSVFEFGDTLVREVMVPRTDVVFIHRAKTLRQAMSLALRSGYSRIPVIGENLDDVLGIVYFKDVTRRVYDNAGAGQAETVESLMRPVVFSPDSKPIDDLLREMQRTRHHIVMVVDEFGGIAGLATIEDLVEEIVGEIVDEYDAEPDLAQPVEGGGYRVSSRMPLDDLGELLNLELEDEDVETVGGLMAKLLNMVQIPGSVVEWEGLRITAERSTGRRHHIDTCLVVPIAPQEPAPAVEAAETTGNNSGAGDE